MESISNWQGLLHKGNQSFKDKQMLQAEFYYKEAVDRLDQLWSEDLTNVELLMAWICAAHNLSTLFEEQGDNDVSLQYLLLPHHRLLSIVSSCNYEDDVQLIAMRALKITFMPILSFTKKHPVCAECLKTMKEFELALAQQEPQLH